MGFFSGKFIENISLVRKKNNLFKVGMMKNKVGGRSQTTFTTIGGGGH